jgi:hypothetical protein
MVELILLAFPDQDSQDASVLENKIRDWIARGREMRRIVIGNPLKVSSIEFDCSEVFNSDSCKKICLQ